MSDDTPVFVDFAQIPLGFTSDQDIFDSNGTKLLAAGCELNETIRNQVLARGDTAISLPKACEKRTPSARPEVKREFQETGSLCDQRIDRSGEDLSEERAARFEKQAQVTLDVIASLGPMINSVDSEIAAKIAELPGNMTQMLLEDADQAIATLGNSSELANRCARLCMLTINTGIELGLDDEDVNKIGLAALLHDLSLFLMPEKFRDPSAPLSQDEIWEYRRHPTLLNVSKGGTTISDEVCVIASQVHERADGSGYPRGLKSHLLHPLSPILHLVDSYQTLAMPGPGRPPVMPHDAMAWLLHEGLRGAHSPKTTRAFISQLSLFPIGSDIELDNGATATVIRRDQAHYARPVVRVHGTDAPPLALSKSPINILRPVSNPKKPQMRLTADEISKLSFSDFQH